MGPGTGEDGMLWQARASDPGMPTPDSPSSRASWQSEASSGGAEAALEVARKRSCATRAEVDAARREQEQLGVALRSALTRRSVVEGKVRAASLARVQDLTGAQIRRGMRDVERSREEAERQCAALQHQAAEAAAQAWDGGLEARATQETADRLRQAVQRSVADTENLTTARIAVRWGGWVRARGVGGEKEMVALHCACSSMITANRGPFHEPGRWGMHNCGNSRVVCVRLHHHYELRYQG